MHFNKNSIGEGDNEKQQTLVAMSKYDTPPSKVTKPSIARAYLGSANERGCENKKIRKQKVYVLYFSLSSSFMSLSAFLSLYLFSSFSVFLSFSLSYFNFSP